MQDTQNLKIYIVVQDTKTKEDVNITGNFEILRAFLLGLGELQSIPDARNQAEAQSEPA
ncbi:MAG: hypothetical protein ACOYYF_08460 [Chloroflexota bacterium]